MFDDPRAWAAVWLFGTLLVTAWYSWPRLPHFPIEFSQMAWTSSEAHCIMASGMSVAGLLMFRYHWAEGSGLGQLGAVCMSLLAIVNGNSTARLRLVHAVIAFTCFVSYVIYIWTSGGSSASLLVASVCILLAHCVILTQLDYADLWRTGFRAWHTVWERSELNFPMWVRQVKALSQWTMIAALFISLFRLPPSITSQ
jgi:hypothetical protein